MDILETAIQALQILIATDNTGDHDIPSPTYNKSYELLLELMEYHENAKQEQLHQLDSGNADSKA